MSNRYVVDIRIYNVDELVLPNESNDIGDNGTSPQGLDVAAFSSEKEASEFADKLHAAGRKLAATEGGHE